jgi:hypothetical protein
MTWSHTPKVLVDKAIAGGLSSIRLVGGVLGVFYENYMQAPYNRRLQQWQRTMTEVVTELAAKYDTLPNDDVLLDALINATRAAQATSEQEKLDALRNAVLNAVAPHAPDTYEQSRFFRLVDQFSAAHLMLARSTEYRPSSLYERLDDINTRGREWRDLLAADLSGAPNLGVHRRQLHRHPNRSGRLVPELHLREQLTAHKERQEVRRKAAGLRWQNLDLVFTSEIGTQLDAARTGVAEPMGAAPGDTAVSERSVSRKRLPRRERWQNWQNP